MVIDDQHGRRHQQMVARDELPRIRDSPVAPSSVRTWRPWKLMPTRLARSGAASDELAALKTRRERELEAAEGHWRRSPIRNRRRN
jgi:hypothetical protein